jgi:hypothetical protein
VAELSGATIVKQLNQKNKLSMESQLMLAEFMSSVILQEYVKSIANMFSFLLFVGAVATSSRIILITESVTWGGIKPLASCHGASNKNVLYVV